METKKLIIMLFAALYTLPTMAAKIKGNGHVITKEIPVEAFDVMRLNASLEFNSSSLSNWIKGEKETFPAVHYSQEESRTLKIKMDENLFSHLFIEVSAGCLSIRTDSHEQLVPTCLTIEAGSKQLNKLLIGGSLDFVLESSLSGGDLEISISGAGDVSMKKPVRKDKVQITVIGSGDIAMRDLKCTSFAARLSGSGDLSLSGTAAEADYHSSGSGDIDAYGFQVDKLVCTTTGSGDIEAYAVKTLKARSSGSGDIHYRGPAQVEKSETGSGDIEKH